MTFEHANKDQGGEWFSYKTESKRMGEYCSIEQTEKPTDGFTWVHDNKI